VHHHHWKQNYADRHETFTAMPIAILLLSISTTTNRDYGDLGDGVGMSIGSNDEYGR
jgi:hypothetical protein